MKKDIEHLFKDKFQNFEPQSPDIWHDVHRKLLIRKISLYSSVILVVAIMVAVLQMPRRDKRNEALPFYNFDIEITSVRQSTMTQNHKEQTKTNKVKIMSNIVDNKNIKTNKLIQGTHQIVDSDVDFDTSDVNSGCIPLHIFATKNGTAQWIFNDRFISDKDTFDYVVDYPSVQSLKLTKGDSVIFEKQVTAFDKPVADFEVPNKIFEKQAVLFTSTDNGSDELLWFIDGKFVGDGSVLSYTFNTPGEHNVMIKISNQNGCSDSLEKIVTVLKSEEQPVSDIVFPTAFTPSKLGPNGGYYSDKQSDVNSIFRPFVYGKVITEFTMKIYSRYGRLIFETNDINRGWDGYINDKLAPVGVYVYIATGKFSDGTYFKKTGSVTLVY